MTTPRTQNLLWFTTAVSLVAGVAALVMALKLPLAMSDDVAQGTAASNATTRPTQTPPLSNFAAAWSRDLRQSLDEVPRPASATVPVPANTLSVRLVGTIIDPAKPRGIFMTQVGQLELRSVGEKAGGAEILSIDDRSATLSIAGRPVTLKLEKVEFTVPVAPSARVP